MIKQDVTAKDISYCISFLVSIRNILTYQSRNYLGRISLLNKYISKVAQFSKRTGNGVYNKDMLLNCNIIDNSCLTSAYLDNALVVVANAVMTFDNSWGSHNTAEYKELVSVLTLTLGLSVDKYNCYVDNYIINRW